ncbi:hypothetical protein BC832DRAFT_543638 [Gaertneriomyces semiglobifer]|nr:hypothetical protein BC832DRAFT_543638 [Gaertneriomyces semiglobifer]
MSLCQSRRLVSKGAPAFIDIGSKAGDRCRWAHRPEVLPIDGLHLCSTRMTRLQVVKPICSPRQSFQGTYYFRRLFTSATCPRAKELVNNLASALANADEDPGHFWDSFKMVCESPEASRLVTRTLAKQAIRHTMRWAATGDLVDASEKLAYLETQLERTGWVNLRTYIRNAEIPRRRQSLTEEGALSMLDAMLAAGDPPDSDTYMLLIDVMGSIGKGEAAERIAQKMVEAGYTLDADIYLAILQGYARGLQPDSAVSILRRMESEKVPVDVRHYTTLMSGYVKLHDTENARALYAEMEGRGIKPTVITFNVLLLLCFLNGEIQAAGEIFSLTHKNGLKPSADTYNTMINGFAKLSRLDDAVSIFNAMRSAGVAPNAITYGTIIHATAKEGMMLHSMRFYRQLIRSNLGLNRYHYTILQNAFASVRDMEASQQVLTDMVRHYAPTTLNYNICIKGWVKLGQLEKALEEVDKMRMAGFQPDGLTWKYLLRGYASVDRLDDAMTAYDKLQAARNFSPTSGTYTILIDLCCRLGQISKAEDLYRASVRRRVTPTYSMFARIAVAYSKTGDLAMALAWVERMRQNKFVPRMYLYNILIRTAARARDMHMAKSLYHHMRKDNVSPTTYTYNCLLLAFSRDPAAVSSLLDEMEKAQLPFDDYTYATVMYISSATHRNFDQAWRLWQQYLATRTRQKRRQPAQLSPVVAQMILSCCHHHKREQQALAVREIIERYKIDIKPRMTGNAVVVANESEASYTHDVELLNVVPEVEPPDESAKRPFEDMRCSM